MDEQEWGGGRYADGVPLHAFGGRAQQDRHLGRERREEGGGDEGRLPEHCRKEVVVQGDGGRDHDDQGIQRYEQYADRTDRRGQGEEGTRDRRCPPPVHGPSTGGTVRPCPPGSRLTRYDVSTAVTRY